MLLNVKSERCGFVCLFLCAVFSFLTCSVASAAELFVNEVMADNDSAFADPQGQFDDWIEIFNAGTQAVDLGGMYLTDNLGNLNKWRVPTTEPGTTTVAANDFLIIWADKDTDDGVLHADFNLDALGEEVGLVAEDGETIVDSMTFGAISSDLSFGRYTDGQTNLFVMITPTPASANALPPTSAITFSLPGGAYTESLLNLTLSSASPGATIYYTTDGSLPTDSSLVYSNTLAMNNTTWIRAIGYEAGKAPSLVETHVYMMIHENLADFSSDLPIVLLETLGFDHEATRTRTFQPSYFVILDTNETGRTTMTNATHFAGYGGLHARGASSFGQPKVNLGMEFWTQDNEDKDAAILGMPADSDWVLYGPYKAFFDNKNMSDNVFAFEMFRQMGHYAPRTRYVEVFMNTDSDKVELESGFTGKDYHGVYVLMEKIKRGDDRVDIKKVDASDLTEPAISGGYIFKREQTSLEFHAGGENLLFVEPVKEDMNGPMTAQRDWLIDYLDDFVAAQAASSKGYLDYVDMHSWVDTHLFMSLTKARDTMTKSRYTYKDRGKKLIMGPPWDYDGSLDGNTTGWDGAGSGGSGSGIWTSSWWHKDTGLFKDYDFWQAWVDRYFELRRDVFSETNLVAVMDGMSNAVWEAHFRNAERWVPSAYPQSQTWLKDRVAWMDDQFLAVPTMSQTGGVVLAGYALSMSGTDTLYYTLDGTDPRGPDGVVAASALIYSGTIAIMSNTIVRARVWDGQAWIEPPEAPWSAPNNAVFAVSPHTVTITELMVEPRAPESGTAETNFVSSDFEFVEISNTSIEPVYLAGLQFSDGIEFDWSYGQVRSLGVGESAIIVNNLVAFKLRYPNWAAMKIAGEFEGTLNNGGERIRLDSYTGQVYALFTYNSSRGWPLSARGAGHSLVPLITGDQSTGLLDYGGNWRASGLVDGSPGLPDPAPGIHVTINEIAAHTDTALPAPDDSDDWIELHNPQATPVDVSGWYISDDADRLTHVMLPAGSIIATNGFMTLRESTHFHTNRLDGSGFGLNKAGESVFLSRDTGSGLQVVDAVAFKGQPNGPTLGRYADSGDYLYELDPTTNAPNAAPKLHVLISELMVHPLVNTNEPTQATTHEYVELYNPLSTNVALWTEAGAWRLDGGVDFVFPTNTTLAPSEYVLVVGFDPQDTVTLTDFIDSYGLTNGQVRIFGPYTGRLDNRTERVALERPQEADLLGDPVSWIIIDEVVYFVDTPWPTGTAGTGGSLQRSVSPGSGRDPGNWIGAIEGTPGVPGTLLAIASPASGTRYFAPDTAEVSVAIEALRVSNAVSQVVIRDGSNVLCVVTQEPYSCVLNIDDVRSYFLTAEMTDGAGVHTSRLVIVDGLQINSLAPTGVTDVAAICVGALAGNGSASVTLYWGDEDGAEDAVAWDHIASRSASGGTPISIPIDHLTAGRTYYYRYRAEVAGRFAWSSNTVSFSTTPLSEWPHQVSLQFPGAPASPLTNFPVLIKLHEGISGFSYSQFSSVDGFDLRVGAGSNGEAIPYEVEQWNTGAVSYIWALVPELSTGTWVNVHWGNPLAAAQPPAYTTDSSLWRDDYAAVWHLNADLSDASSHQADAVSTGSLAASGIVAGGRLFDGIDDVLRQGPGATWYSQHMQDMTVSLWIHPTAIGGVPFGAAVDGDITQDFGFRLNTHPLGPHLFMNMDGGLTIFGQFSLGEWQLLTITVSNGVPFAAKNDLAPVQAGPLGGFLPTRQPTLGNLAGGDDPFTGRLDELRVSPKARSAAWIKATYRTVAEHDTFASYGAVVSGGPFVDADGNGLPDAWEQHFFGTTGINEEGHGDADLMDNESEYVAGTDPTNSADFFWIGIETGAVNPVFYFPTRVTAGEGYEGIDRFYALEERAIFSTGVWSHLPGADRIPATGTTFVYSNAVPATNTPRQYRSKVWLEDTP